MDEPFKEQCSHPDCRVIISGTNPLNLAYMRRQHHKKEHPSWELEKREAAGEFAPEVGPPLYSYWVHTDVFELSPFGTTLLYVTAWHRHSGDGSVEVTYFSVNGTSNNADFRAKAIPDEIRSITIKSFWEMVAFGNLVLLMDVPHFMLGDTGILAIGDEINPD